MINNSRFFYLLNFFVSSGTIEIKVQFIISYKYE